MNTGRFRRVSRVVDPPPKPASTARTQDGSAGLSTDDSGEVAAVVPSDAISQTAPATAPAPNGPGGPGGPGRRKRAPAQEGRSKRSSRVAASPTPAAGTPDSATQSAPDSVRVSASVSAAVSASASTAASASDSTAASASDSAPAIRTELVASLRRAIARGDYDSPEKLDVALDKMLRETLGDD